MPDRDARMVDAIEKILRRNRNLAAQWLLSFLPAPAELLEQPMQNDEVHPSYPVGAGLGLRDQVMHGGVL